MDFFKTLPLEKKLDLYSTMKKIRLFEQTVFQLTSQGLVHGSVHFYIGQEAIAAGIIACLKKEDYIMSTHRCHGHMIAKGADLKKMFAEIMGRVDGYCRGKGGTMHLLDPDIGMMGTNGIVGAGIPIATGLGYACSNFEKGKAVVCFFGDGAINTGAFHESLNIASLWKLPVIYVCENNLYAISTSIGKAASVSDLSRRAVAYGMPGYNTDGNSLPQVLNTARRCIDSVKAGSGPCLMICNTYRQLGHSIHDPRSYRTKEEEDKWLKKGPIARYETLLKKEGVLKENQIPKIDEKLKEEINDALEFAKNCKKPAQKDLFEDVYKLC